MHIADLFRRCYLDLSSFDQVGKQASHGIWRRSVEGLAQVRYHAIERGPDCRIADVVQHRHLLQRTRREDKLNHKIQVFLGQKQQRMLLLAPVLPVLNRNRVHGGKSSTELQ